MLLSIVSERIFDDEVTISYVTTNDYMGHISVPYGTYNLFNMKPHYDDISPQIVGVLKHLLKKGILNTNMDVNIFIELVSIIKHGVNAAVKEVIQTYLNAYSKQRTIDIHDAVSLLHMYTANDLLSNMEICNPYTHPYRLLHILASNKYEPDDIMPEAVIEVVSNNPMWIGEYVVSDNVDNDVSYKGYAICKQSI